MEGFGQRHELMAVNIIGKQSNYKWVALRESGEKERVRLHQELRDLAPDRVRARDYLLDASLLKVLWSLQAARASWAA